MSANMSKSIGIVVIGLPWKVGMLLDTDTDHGKLQRMIQVGIPMMANISKFEEEGNDFSGRCDIEDRRIFERLRIPSKGAWGNDLCNWDQNPTKRDNFNADHCITPTSRESNINILQYGINGQLDHNKSIYVGMVLYEGESGKRTIDNKPASTKLLADRKSTR